MALCGEGGSGVGHWNLYNCQVSGFQRPFKMLTGMSSFSAAHCICMTKRCTQLCADASCVLQSLVYPGDRTRVIVF